MEHQRRRFVRQKGMLYWDSRWGLWELSYSAALWRPMAGRKVPMFRRHLTASIFRTEEQRNFKTSLFFYCNGFDSQSGRDVGFGGLHGDDSIDFGSHDLPKRRYPYKVYCVRTHNTIQSPYIPSRSLLRLTRRFRQHISRNRGTPLPDCTASHHRK
jgi:hypothetical protein